MAVNDQPKRRNFAQRFVDQMEIFMAAFEELNNLADEKASAGFTFSDSNSDFTATDAPLTLVHLDATRINNALTNVSNLKTYLATNSIDDVFNAARPPKA